MAIKTHYSLAPNQIIRRVPPPHPPERLELWRQNSSRSQVAAQPRGPYAMVLHWRPEGAVVWGQAFGRGSGYTIEQLAEFTLRIYRPVIEGDRSLLLRELEGDLVIRPGASEEQYLQAIQDVLEEAWPAEGFSIGFREVERSVDVLSGRWTYRAVDAIAERWKHIEIYGRDLNADRTTGGGGTGAANDFAGWLGRWIDRQVLIESEEVPAGMSWHLSERGDGSELSRASAHDRELVLKHIEEQTGLQWSEQVRRVRRLFVEQNKNAGGAVSLGNGF